MGCDRAGAGRGKQGIRGANGGAAMADQCRTPARCLPPSGVCAAVRGMNTPTGGCVSRQDYEKLAALLDGAKHPLTERVKKFSPASSKIPVVEAAEEHARFLDELARNLSR